MKAVLIILIILFSIILFLLLEILFYKPEIQEEEPNELENTQELHQIETSDSFHQAASQHEDAIRLLYTRLHPLLNKFELDHILIYQYHSAVDENPIVFLLEDDRSQLPFLAAADELNDEAVIRHSFILAIPLTARFRQQAVMELDDWLMEKSIHPRLIMSEGGDNEDLFGNGLHHALIGTGIAEAVKIIPNGVHANEWLAHMSSIPMPMHMSEEGYNAIRSLWHVLPWQLRLETRFKLTQDKAVRDFLQIVPLCSILFQVQIVHEKDSFLLQGCGCEEIQEAVSLLENDAAKYKVTLKKEVLHKYEKLSFGSGFAITSQAVQESFHSKENVPCLLPYQNQLISSIHCDHIWYVPFDEGKKIHPRTAVLFYKAILSE